MTAISAFISHCPEDKGAAARLRRALIDLGGGLAPGLESVRIEDGREGAAAAALDTSDWLIVLCDRGSATSAQVEAATAQFRALGLGHRIIPA